MSRSAVASRASCGFAAEIDEAVRLPRHCRHDDRDLVALLDLVLHARGDIANAFDPGHRGAAELHHDACHGVEVFVIKLLENAQERTPSLLAGWFCQGKRARDKEIFRSLARGPLDKARP
jgi:hypothetical protein